MYTDIYPHRQELLHRPYILIIFYHQIHEFECDKKDQEDIGLINIIVSSILLH